MNTTLKTAIDHKEIREAETQSHRALASVLSQYTVEIALEIIEGLHPVKAAVIIENFRARANLRDPWSQTLIAQAEDRKLPAVMGIFPAIDETCRQMTAPARHPRMAHA